MKVVITFLAVTFACYNFSQSCGCDHLIELETEFFSGDDVAPGETVCLESGMREYLKIKNLNGTSESPILLQNCEGQTAFSTDEDFALALLSSNHVQISGTGSEDYEYGILIQDILGDGLLVNGLSSNIEIDHVKMINLAGTAISIVENPKCDLSANEGYFTFENCSVHDVFIDDCQIGIQIGHPNFQLGFLNPYCGLLFPHDYIGISIVNNQITSANRDAVVLYGVTGVLNNNRLSSTGWNGVYAGRGCHLNLAQNFISNTAFSGFKMPNGGSASLVNNVFYNNGQASKPGVSVSFNPVLGVSYENELQFIHNTVVKSGAENIQVNNPSLATTECRVINNIFCEPTPAIADVFDEAAFALIAETPAVFVSNNSNAITISEQNFLAADLEDFRLTAASPALNVGSPTVIPFDFDNAIRNLGGQPDAGAFEYEPEPIAYFEEIDLVGLYVDDFKNILGDPFAETQLLEYAQDNGFNYLLLYNLAYIHSHDYDLTEPTEAIVLANFIEKAKKDYGIVQMGAVGEKNASFDKIEVFNALFGDSWFRKFDVLNLEFEFWTAPASAVFEYYCETYLAPGGYPCTNAGAYAFYTDQLEEIDERAHSMGIISEIYVGYMTDEESIGLAERTDRILLHHYRTSDTYGDGSSIYNYHTYRIQAIALSERKPAIMPIFSSRSYHMGPWLLSNSLHQPMDTWLNGVEGYYEDDSEGVSELPIAGFQWYRYTSFLDLMSPSRTPNEEVGEIESLKTRNIRAVSQQINNSELTVVFEAPLELVTYSLTIYDMSGKLIWSAQVFDQFAIYNLSELPSGLYMSVLSSDAEILNTTKIIL